VIPSVNHPFVTTFDFEDPTLSTARPGQRGYEAPMLRLSHRSRVRWRRGARPWCRSCGSPVIRGSALLVPRQPRHIALSLRGRRNALATLAVISSLARLPGVPRKDLLTNLRRSFVFSDRPLGRDEPTPRRILLKVASRLGSPCSTRLKRPWLPKPCTG
jgi:hypothetical protein